MLFHCFLSAGSDPNAQTWLGKTALELLLMADVKPEGVVELLWNRGSPVNVFNEITDEGYICIMATNDLNGLESIQQHPFYKEVIDNPERNRVDGMGRTPIHNIVSCSYARIRPDDCAVLIDGFVKVECDIDYQDKKGRTALHVASKFKNGFGIVGVLMNGIDVNLLDLEGNAAFAHCLQPGYSESSDESYILRNIAKNLYKLEFFGRYIKNANIEVGKYIPISAEEKTRITKDCREELEKLKNLKIGSHAIFYFLSETRLVTTFKNVPQLQRNKVDRLFRAHSQQFITEYPELAGLVILQYRKALARQDLIQPAYDSLNRFLRFPMPFTCRDIIFGCLSNDVLKSLRDSILYFSNLILSHLQKQIYKNDERTYSTSFNKF